MSTPCLDLRDVELTGIVLVENVAEVERLENDGTKLPVPGAGMRELDCAAIVPVLETEGTVDDPAAPQKSKGSQQSN